ncbi:type II secretion system protein [Tenacibaculum sp. AHE15PA]|uniref:PulJ/GspJ family protein n=1 Tax=unclassified Tenacibaculum TaxID=2635139 RepID=UPI001C4E40DE|nr:MULTISPECIES: type II secretion system protein [unclassified Tenacibaculum]QXP72529.1 type II secretion system protein [Tenacibaculum sp. AHE14PA]QXP76444.1 type II secretion system protein [Tenacibaculum sp. AHE15PA]
MKLTKKINAFTLSEMLVVLVISSIVIASAFLILTMVQKQFRIIQVNMNQKHEINFFDRILWQDFNKYSITYQKEKDILLLTNPLDSITYSFFKDYVTRGKDTLFVQVVNKELFLNGEKVASGDIDAIKIETTPFYRNKKMFIYTSKDATFYLNK